MYNTTSKIEYRLKLVFQVPRENSTQNEFKIFNVEILELSLEIVHLAECHLLLYQRHRLNRDLVINLRDDLNARLAQSVERWTLNPTVVGSSPTLGVPFGVFYVYGSHDSI